MRSGSGSATSPTCRRSTMSATASGSLRQHAGFAITTVGILALSMAASVTAFSVVSQILLRPLPYTDPDRIVTVWERQPATPGRLDVAPGNFIDWRERATSFTQLAGAEPYSFDYTGGDRPEVLKTLLVTEGFFDIFGIKPLAGRFFRPEEHTKGNNRVVVHQRALLALAFQRRSRHRRQDPFRSMTARSWSRASRRTTSSRTSRSTRPAIAISTPRRRSRSTSRASASAAIGASSAGSRTASRSNRRKRRWTPISIAIEQENPRTNKGVRADVITLARAPGRRRAAGGHAVWRRGHRRAADRLRQRHQPAARARRPAPAGAGRAHRAWREPHAAGRPAAGRDPDAGIGRVGRRAVPRARPRCAAWPAGDRAR